MLSNRLFSRFPSKKLVESYVRVILFKCDVTPGFKGQSRVHLIHAPKKATYIITECIEINVTIIRVFIT
jgi:hypothetical protein